MVPPATYCGLAAKVICWEVLVGTTSLGMRLWLASGQGRGDLLALRANQRDYKMRGEGVTD